MSSDRGGAHHPLVELTLARVREFVREPEALFWTFAFPIVMTIVMAVAFPSRTAQPVPVAVAAAGESAAIDRMRQALTGAPGIVVRDVPVGGEQRALRDGEVHLVVVPTDPPTYQFDAAREESRTARLVVDAALKRAAGHEEPWAAREEPVDVPGSRYVDWLLPGLVGMGIMGNSMWGIGFSIVQTRMRRLLKRMAASPMRKSEFLMAQVLARLLFLLPEVVLPLAFGVLVFAMPVHGRVANIAVVSVVGALAFGALGLLLGSRARTFEAVSGMMNLVMLPMWLLSGVFFATSNFPAFMQPAIHVLPLTSLVDALRTVVLEGAGLVAVRGEMIRLSIWALLPFGLALRIFKWR
jgi:ABC-type multidrug transport system permease subunit